MTESPSIDAAPGGSQPNSPEPASSHPSVDTWIDYHAGRAPARETESLRRHLAGCRRCIDLVLDLDAFAEPSPPAAGAAADFEKAAVWRTVKPAVDADRGVAAPTRTAWRWPTIAAIAASLLFAVAGLSQRGARIELESQVAELSRLQPNMQILDLRPGARERSLSDGDAMVELSATAGAILILTPEDAAEFPAYEVRVVDAAGVEVRRVSGLEISEFGNFSLAVPPGALAAGSYELELIGLGDLEQPIETYPIRLR